MDWTILLKSQQIDFIERLKSGHLLHSELEGKHSELTTISGDKLNQLRNFCWEMVKKYKPDDPRKYFINSMKGKLGEEVIKARLGNFVTEVDYEKKVGGDGKIDFYLTSDPSIGIQVKARYGDIDTVQWSISKQEMEKNAVLVCVLIQEEVNEAQTSYSLVFAGFIPTIILKKENKASVQINELLYCSGLQSFLESCANTVTANGVNSTNECNNTHLDNAYLENNFYGYPEDKLIDLTIEYFNAANNYFQKFDYNAIILNDYQRTVNYFDVAINLIEDIAASIYYNRGRIRYYFGEIKEAINDFTESIKKNPRYYLSYLYRGQARSVIGYKEAAINDYTEALKINVKCDEAYFGLGLIYDGLRDRNKAINYCHIAIKINPNHYKYLLYRGDMYYKMRDNKGAIADYTSAININPNLDIAFSKRGTVRYELKDKSGAVEDYTQATNINPKDFISYFNRSIARYELGDQQGAINDYKRACSIKPQIAKLEKVVQMAKIVFSEDVSPTIYTNSYQEHETESEELRYADDEDGDVDFFSNQMHLEDYDERSLDYGYLEDLTSEEYYDYF